MIAEQINTLAEYLGRRDISTLTAEALEAFSGKRQADVFVLFGGSILAGADVFAQAKKNQIAKKYIIVGGAGHTTPTLRQLAGAVYPDFDTKNLSEAEVFDEYIFRKHGYRADFLECRSTNCGNNITYLLALLKEKEIPCRSIILCQDATMQLRMHAGMKKYQPEMEIINYAAYQVRVKEIQDCLGDGGKGADSLIYDREITGMWSMDPYISLLMGEIPRLKDGPEGYGPNGKGFISHVEIPDHVQEAFEQLRKDYAESVRKANPKFAG